jgi:uncharacterized protein (TIGR02246 family)
MRVVIATEIAIGCACTFADDAASNQEQAIRASAAVFVQAFNQGNSQVVAALWTPQGTLADDQGELLKGRQAIAQKYATFFKENPGAKIEISITSIEFPTPVVAIEDGTAQIASDHPGPPTASRYTAVHVMENGKWLMSSVRETRIDVLSAFVHLADLQWLIGRWHAEANGTMFQTEFRWIANKSFIQRDSSTRSQGVVTSSGTQIIGWNPQAGRVQSWSFDSSGGHGVGYWTATPDGWRIQSIGMQADGTRTFALDWLLQVALENDVFGWRSIDRKVGNTPFPDMPEIVFDRVREK